MTPESGIVESDDTSAANQWLGKYVPMATNTHATIEELLDTVFSVRFLLCQILNI
jgi:hypothetical protein